MRAIPKEVRAVAAAVEAAGGRAYLVGGAVADVVVGREPADWDVEVYGLDMPALQAAVAAYSPKVVGRCHEIVSISVDGVEIDVNLPVRANGAGLSEADPHMDPAEAARRRDFTMNAMFMDITTGTVHDPFGGSPDAYHGVLRVVDEETFVEDPIRCLRAAQLYARKCRDVDQSVFRCMQRLAETVDLAAYPKERVHAEWRKLMMKAKDPSQGLEILRVGGWLRFFPELDALVGCPQSPEHHPEGDVWTHTLLVVDAAARLRDRVEDEKDREAFMFSALCHDLGKAVTTDPVTFEAHGHDQAGGSLARSFLERFVQCPRIVDQAVALTAHHMRPHGLMKGDARPSRWAVLQRDLAPATLFQAGLLSRSDWTGSRPYGVRHFMGEHATSAACFRYHRELAGRHSDVRPLVTGRDLVAAGHKPGPAFRDALQAALDAQVDGCSDREELLRVAFEKLEV